MPRRNIYATLSLLKHAARWRNSLTASLFKLIGARLPAVADDVTRHLRGSPCFAAQASADVGWRAGDKALS